MTSPYCFRTVFILKILQIIEINFVNGNALPSSPNVVEVTHLCGAGYSALVSKCLEQKGFDVRITSRLNTGNGQLITPRIPEIIHLDSSSTRGCHFGIGVLDSSIFRNVPDLKRFRIETCNLQTVAKGVFEAVPKLEFLSIHHNEINYIENRAFANLVHLKHINASYNNLENFNSGWFDGSTNIETMDFQGNKIHLILRKAFAGFSKLKVINFNNNDISLIESEAFEDVENLDYLGLRSNKLSNIPAEIFPNKIKIGYVAIGANYLNFLSTDLMERILVKKIVMDFNPWHCSCLEDIDHWLFTTNATKIKDTRCDNCNIPICATKTTVFGNCSEIVDKEVDERYFEALRKLYSLLGEGCARLDYAP